MKFTGGDKPNLQVMAENTETGEMVVEDCAAVSRAISAVLDVEDPIKGNYTLEVSSPGIDRPLVRDEDFGRFAGFEARIDTRMPVDGRKRFTGRLLGIEGGIVTIKVEDTDVELAFQDIDKAKLLLTDELIAELFLPQEIEYAGSQAHPWENFAARFAAKEAAFKALGAGLSQGLRFRDVEVCREVSGAVSLRFLG